MTTKTYLPTIDLIKQAVDAGKTVHCDRDGYTVRKSGDGLYYIMFDNNEYQVGLHGREGSRFENRLNGKSFYYYS